MGEHFRSVDPLPPEAVIGYVIVLVPGKLRGIEVLQACLPGQLGKAIRITENIRQPEYGRVGLRAKMLGKESPAEKELPGQRFGPADIAVRLNPHPAGGFPSTFRHFVFDSPEQLRIILPDVVIQLRLTLSECVLFELVHQRQHRMK